MHGRWPRKSSISKAQIFHLKDSSLNGPAPQDVVVHFRALEVDYGATARYQEFPTNDYFDAVFSTLDVSRAKANYSFAASVAAAPPVVWIVTEPALHSHEVVKHLIANYSSRIYGGTPEQDSEFAKRASTFVGSQGTFSWMIAFLSQGQRIHLPYLRDKCQGAIWLPWHELFIHDDDRIRYHALESPSLSQSAAEVLQGGSEFARCVLGRTDRDAPWNIQK